MGIHLFSRMLRWFSSSSHFKAGCEPWGYEEARPNYSLIGRMNAMFIVGVDIAKRNHEAVVIDQNGSVLYKPFSFSNDSEGFRIFLNVLDAFSRDSKDFLIGMESTSHYWYALYSGLERQGYSVCVLNPLQSNALRNMYIRQVKNDSHDSFLIAEVIRFGRYTEGRVPTVELHTLRELCRARYFISDMAADLKKKVIALLDQVFPEYETIFTDIFGLTSCALLLCAPTPREILALEDQELSELLAVPSRKRFRLAKALEIKQIAASSFGMGISDTAISLLIKQHISHIQFMAGQIQELSSQISQLFLSFNSCITTIPGIGPVLGASIFSEIGDVSRFPSAAKLVAFAGIDPTVKQSGQFTATHNYMSKRGSPYLRRSIWMAASTAIHCDPVLKEFFQKKRAEGKPYMNAVGHVTRKLTAIIYAVLRDNKPYVPRSI